MSDYETWLAKVRGALEGKNKRAVARWLAERMGTAMASTEVKLHRLLSGDTIPRADLAFALHAWMDAGGPDASRYQGSPGGKARAGKLSSERRREIARKANEVKAEGRRRKAEGKTEGTKASRHQGNEPDTDGASQA